MESWVNLIKNTVRVGVSMVSRKTWILLKQQNIGIGVYVPSY